jgi:hypothetical protein
MDDARRPAPGQPPGPRLFGIPATDAPVVAVIRRGPSGWTHLGRWDTDHDRYEAGSWLRGTIFPQRSDLSPDGRWFAYFALKGGARWPAGATYIAVSRLPWLTALVAWATDGTWTRGCHFTEPGGPPVGGPRPTDAPGLSAAVGDPAPLLERYGLAWTRAATFAVERRRGWTETADTPPRGDDDPWDERRASRVTMEKPRPGDARTRLLVSGRYAAFRDMQPRWGPPRYAVRPGDGTARDTALADVQWADWDSRGRLLVATAHGELQVREDATDARSVAWRQDFAAMRPAPVEPPAEAGQW